MGYPLRTIPSAELALPAEGQPRLAGPGGGPRFAGSGARPARLLPAPQVSPVLPEPAGGARLERYGAKTISEGGYFSIPRLALDHAMVLGESGGLVNVPRLKGIHYAIKSGMAAAEQAVIALVAATSPPRRSALRPRDARAPRRGRLGGTRAPALPPQQGQLPGGFVPAWRDRVRRSCSAAGGRADSASSARTTPTCRSSRTSTGRPRSSSGRSTVKVDNEKLLYDRLTASISRAPCRGGPALPPRDHARERGEHLQRPLHEGVRQPCQYFCPASVYEMEEKVAGSARRR